MKVASFFLIGLVLLLTVMPLGAVWSEPEAPKIEPKKGMVGIQISEKDGKFYIFKVLNNSPAKDAGLETGDVLVTVAGQDIRGMKLAEVLNLFNGEPTTDVDVIVERNGSELSPFTLGRISPQALQKVSPDFRQLTRLPHDREKESSAIPEKPTPREEILLETERVKKWLDHYEKAYGFRAVLLDKKFGEKVGAIFHEGILILEVRLGTPAFKANLEKWDIIYRIENLSPEKFFLTRQPPSDPSKPSPLRITLMGLTGEKQIKLDTQ